MLFSSYTLVCKGKGQAWFRLRCLVWFFLIAANIYTSGAVNNELFSLSSNQPSKSWRGGPYSVECLGFLGEGGERGMDILSAATVAGSPGSALLPHPSQLSSPWAGMTCRG